MITRPKTEGISGTRLVTGDEAAGPPLRRLKAGATLADLQSEYELFNYAPLFLYGGLEHNIVQEWINQNNYPQIVFILQLDKPILHIGAGPIWDCALWAINKDYWFSLSLHIGSIGLLDRSKRKFTRAICQQLPVPDVVANAKSGVSTPKMVTITTFAVDSNLGCLAFAPAALLLMKNRPYLKFHPPQADTIKLADALLAESENPYLST